MLDQSVAPLIMTLFNMYGVSYKSFMCENSIDALYCIVTVVQFFHRHSPYAVVFHRISACFVVFRRISRWSRKTPEIRRITTIYDETLSFLRTTQRRTFVTSLGAMSEEIKLVV